MFRGHKISLIFSVFANWENLIYRYNVFLDNAVFSRNSWILTIITKFSHFTTQYNVMKCWTVNCGKITVWTFSEIFSVCKNTILFSRLDALSLKLKQFHVLVDSEASTRTLIKNPRSDGKKWSVFMKLDCDNNRGM